MIAFRSTSLASDSRIRRGRIGLGLLVWLLAISPARALFNLQEGKELIFVSGTYSIGFDSNVFTRAAAKSSITQSASASLDYSRQAGLISVTAGLSVSTGLFENVRGQNFTDPSVSLAFRKRYGRTTGSLGFTGRRDSQPDPDAGQRTQSWNYTAGLDLRYPVNDRYYFTNALHTSFRFYTDRLSFSDLGMITDAVALNYVYTSKLDLNAAYTVGVSNTSKNTNALDQSLTFGASGGILPKLSGSVNMGITHRSSDSTIGGKETFNGFTSGTSLKWLFSRKLIFNAELNDDFSITSTDISVNRAIVGLHATESLSSKYIGSAGVSYSISDFLGRAGAGRRDELFQFDASIGVAITTHVRTSLAYLYMINTSNSPGAQFQRQSLTFTIIATY